MCGARNRTPFLIVWCKMQIFGSLSVRRAGVFEQPACRFFEHNAEYQGYTLTAESQVTHFFG